MLRTSATADPGGFTKKIGRLAKSGATHVVISYSPGRLLVVLNGQRALDTNEIKGVFAPVWHPRGLYFGKDAWLDDHAWHGELEGIAIYDRFMDLEEARENARRFANRMSRRPAVETHVVDATLVQRSKPPSVSGIAPYREALVVHEYQPVNTTAIEDRIRVAHWSILDATQLSTARARVGDRRTLKLQDFSENPQLHHYIVQNDLSENLDIPLYYSVE